MKYALENGNRVEAVKGIKAVCPICEVEMVAKCGEFRIDHWAHKSIRNCDSWWEPETEWHRKWKNYYPEEWQEKIMLDEETGEKHIADVRTQHDLTIEFQHSAIRADERRSREAFYKKMLWVMDGTRLKQDFPRFHKAIYKFHHTDDPQLVYVDVYSEHLPAAWVGSTVPVVFDFSAHETIEDVEGYRKMLYCLLPQKKSEGRYAKMVKLTAQEFVEKTTSGEWPSFIQKYIDAPNEYHLLQQVQSSQPINTNPVRGVIRWRENFRYLLALIGFLFFIVSIARHNASRRKVKRGYAYSRNTQKYRGNRQYLRK